MRHRRWIQLILNHRLQKRLQLLLMIQNQRQTTVLLKI
nr:MAG TPA: hypothetical protein [Caudoviricetes sp.]